jgi:D-glycero-D-manno-heptose 1,7-bisphosphate phosphatase
MVPFHGRPFLGYLLDLLRSQGIERVLILLGYKAEAVQEHFGDGGRFGLMIDYSVSPVEDETGRRLRLAKAKLDPCFLLLYCDNYWPMRMPEMWKQFLRSGASAMITAYANRDQYTRNNVRVDDDGRVMVYDKSRTQTGLNGVEIGYALLSRSVLEFLPEGNVSFEGTVYPALVERGLLHAFMTEHRYYSVGSHERLHLTEAFLAPQKAVILDRDGVLNKKPPRACYVTKWDEFEWLPGAIEGLRLLKRAGYKVILATNQAGVSRGIMSVRELEALHERMQAELKVEGAELDAIYYCPHGWDEGCFCRKPNPGLLYQAQREHHLDLTRTVFIGDDERDLAAGSAAGCPTFLVSPDCSLLERIQQHVPLEGGPLNHELAGSRHRP